MNRWIDKIYACWHYCLDYNNLYKHTHTHYNMDKERYEKLKELMEAIKDIDYIVQNLQLFTQKQFFFSLKDDF